MRKTLLILVLGMSTLLLQATTTTYTFTNAQWGSKVGTITCDNVTDGWKSTDEGSTFTTGQGVTIYSSGDGTGEAMSYIQWTNIRKVIVHYCTNSSNGAGTVAITIGDDDTTMTQSVTKEGGTTIRDMEFPLLTEKSGRVTLSVHCTTNSIHIYGISIKADNCSPAVFTNKTYHLMTNLNEIGDSAWVMFGIADGKTNKVMGYFDESVSKNNIHAISAKYDATREYVNGNEEVTYLIKPAISEGKKQASYTIYDPYWAAYLVANGGKTKNALRVWNKCYDEGTYGDYGYWDIDIAADGKATIMSLGNSLGKYIQYNPSFDLFGCYPNLQMTDVAIYKQEEEKDLSKVIIQVPMIAFGTQVMRAGDTIAQGSKTIEIKTNRLTEDLMVSLQKGTVFALDTNRVDRDGDKLTIRYATNEVGSFLDTLVLTNADTTLYVNVTLKVTRELTIEEACHVEEMEYIYLNTMVVTKKYDKYVYVRDSTGSMLLIDEGPTTEHYAKDLEKGVVISKVEGRFQNYYGVPELHMAAKPSAAAKKVECLPESVTRIDSADVCRYVQFDSVPFTNEPVFGINLEDEVVVLSEKFTLPQASVTLTAVQAAVDMGIYHRYRVEGIVSYDWEQVVLYPTFIEQHPDQPQGIEAPSVGFPVEGQPYKVLRNGQIVIIRREEKYSVLGERL